MNELNDKTKKGHYFKVGNTLIDKYAKHIGPIATSIYICLKRHANIETRIAFPSHKLIAEELNINPRTVLRNIKTLVIHRFITINKRKYKGKWANNVYYLTYSNDWLTEPCDLKSHDNVLLPRDKKCNNNMTLSHINNTNNKKIEVSKTFKEYKPRFLSNNDP